MRFLVILFLASIAVFTSSMSSKALSAQSNPCAVTDKLCLMQELERTADDINNKAWRDKTYRELAKSYTYEGHADMALALLNKIETPDVKAMTIRGIGMAAADSKWPKKDYPPLFEKLTNYANNMEHLPSQAIAYTYIAMSQAFAKDNEGAIATARSMHNDALRHKAFAEIAEIQAEKGRIKEAFSSIAQIESDSFKNKAYATIARIFTKRDQLDDAYRAAQLISNKYSRSQILQHILNKGNIEEDMNAAAARAQ